MTAREFLQFYRPSGPWYLVAFDSENSNSIIGRKITVETLDRLEPFLIKHNRDSKKNIYFHVNPIAEGAPLCKGRASKEHITHVEWAHVDVDPDKRADLEVEQKRILALFEKPPAGIPRPSILIFSGGGYQGFWRYETPFFLDKSDEILIAKAEAVNRGIVLKFGGDASTFNIDRIMRLPGTTNWPTKKKLEVGREPTEAKVVWAESGSFKMSDFPQAYQAPKRQVNGIELSIDQNTVERLVDVDELDRYKVKDSVKALIVQGVNTETGTRVYESDSEGVFFVACELVRQAVPNEVIYSILTDPDFYISAHVLRQPNIHRYALRQIERAHEEAESPELREMNDRFALIGHHQGSARVLWRKRSDVLKQDIWDLMTLSAFRDLLIKRKIVLGDKTMPLSKWWLEHPKGKMYEGVCFLPNEIPPEGYFNMWDGFAVRAEKGNWGLLEEHIFENICSSNTSHFLYLLNWMARGVQYPGKPGLTAVVLRSSQEGTGKSFFARAYGSLFGSHATVVSSSKHITGQFNEHLRNIVYLFADEAFRADEKDSANKLRALITEDVGMIEKKGVDPELVTNRVSLVLASNDDWVVPAGVSDRRFFVLDVGDGRIQDTAYFQAIRDQLEAGGYEAMLYDLLHRDIASFDVRKIPQTAALTKQKKHTLPPLKSWWYTCLTEGRVSEEREWDDPHPIKELFWLASVGTGDKQLTPSILKNFLEPYLQPGSRRIRDMEIIDEKGTLRRVSSATCRFWKPLEECIRIWERETTMKVIREPEPEDAQEEEPF